MKVADINLRPTTPEDQALLMAIYGTTRAEELKQVPDWTEEHRQAFIAHQFHAQDVYYKEVYPDSAYSVIQLGNQPIGRLYVERYLIEGTIRIIDIAILPEFQNRGVGEYLLRNLQEEARQAGKSLTIHVEKFNRALNFYIRLGFEIIKETHGVYLLMEWKPGDK